MLLFSHYKLCLTLCNPMDCKMSGLAVLHSLLEFAQVHVHRVSSGSVGKESACNAGRPGLIPGWGRSPGEGNGKPL